MRTIVRRFFTKKQAEQTIDESTHHGLEYKRVHYHDLKKVDYVSNSSLVELINISKQWLKQGIEVRFINAKDNIKGAIKKLGLDDVLKFE